MTMQNTSSQVYRYKSVDAYRYSSKYHRRERLKEALFAAFSFGLQLAFVIMFVKWWIM